MILNVINFFCSPASISGPYGYHIQGSFAFVFSVTGALVSLFVLSLVWVHQDAVKRGRNGWVAMLFVLITGWPGSYLWWFWLRPPLLREEVPSARPLPPLPSPAS
jgi:hypothetical protein